jgi:hypothetical protein
MQVLQKINLRRSYAAWLFYVIIFFSTLLGVYLTRNYFYFFGGLALLLISDSLSTFSITPDFIQKREKKILLKDIVDVRSFLIWIIIVDRYNETIFMIPQWIRPSDKTRMFQAIGLVSK